MKDYLLLLLAALLLACDFAMNKLYQKQAGTSLRAGFGFNAVVGILTAVLCFCINGFTFHFSWYSLIMATAMAVLLIAYILLGFRILKAGSMALYTLFLMTGGMTVPYVWGLLFLDEPFSVWRTLGLLLIIFAVALSNLGGGKTNFRQLVLCLAIFLLNGMTSVVSKLHQIETAQDTVNAMEFVLLVGLLKFVLAGAGYLIFTWKDRKTQAEAPRGSVKLLLPVFVGSALAGGLAYALQLMGAANLPATVLYPFVTGGSMVFSTLVGILFFREKPSKALILGVALCFVGTLLFL
ncbi:MAG: DMT family transporter [Clostridia bacterium]|nr:DMT family transporter [Clostridia bacterium]